MSIASVSNRWLNRLYKILAIMLVLLAVLISALRLFLPYVENYRQDFQDYLNNSNQTNIVIGSLGMSWQRSGPVLIANEVTLIDNEDVHVSIKHLSVQVDFWASITEQRLISSDLILDGASVALEQSALNRPSSTKEAVTESSSKRAEPQISALAQISDIFLNRINRFSLVNSQVSIKHNVLERNFSINNLNWLNSSGRHQAQGNITVDELSSNNLKLKIDVNGYSIDDLKGTLYVEANHLDITPWLDNVLAIENDHTKADVGFSAWLKIEKGTVERLQVALHDNFISWQENKPIDDNLKELEQTLSLSSGQLLLVKGKKPDSFKLFSTPLLLKLNQQDEQEHIVQFNKSAENYSIYLSSFDLALISQVSPLFISAKATQQLLAEIAITGHANDIYINKTADDIQALAKFSDTATRYSSGIPGVDNISGNLSFAEQSLHVEFEAQTGVLDFKHHFVLPIPYQTLKAKVDLEFADEGWLLKVNNIALASEELTLSADLAVDSPKDSQMVMSLLASITNGDASKAGHYYPLTTMSSDLVDYLNAALISGEINQAQVLINGPLNQFPFANNEGIFVVDAELENSTFKFSPEWPEISNFFANLNFTNNSMLITGRSGELAGLNVSGVQAAIDKLGHDSILNVDALIKPSPAKNVAKLMNQSSLKDSVGSVLQQLQVSGDIEGEFHLYLPLNNSSDVLASGLINFADNNLALQTPRMDFSQVNGQLSFENAKITTNDLKVNWQGLPFKLAVNGNDNADYYDTHIALSGDWQKQDWFKHIDTGLTKYIDESLALSFQGDLSLYQHHGGGFSYQLNLDSDLAQIALELPEPYNKIAKAKVPLKIAVNGQLEQSTFNASYGDKLSFFGVLDHDNSHFSRAHIVLGNEKMLLPMDGFHITTNLEQADVSVWQPFISDIINAASADSLTTSSDSIAQQNLPLFSKPERIRGTIAQLDLLGQQLHNVTFNLLDKSHWWLLQLNSKETRSQVKFFPDWIEQGIEINADFIQLSSALVTEENQQAIPKDKSPVALITDEDVFANMPKISFHCDRCQIDNLNLGVVDFSITRTNENVIKIDHFTAKREQAKFDLSGQWQKTDDAFQTSVEGKLSLKNIEYELEQLGFGSIIRDSGGKLDFDLNWPGGLHDFAISRLNGELNAKIDDGYLAEYSDTARIFSVLSLESIVRKLTLDFRDIFSDGMFYKDIKGDYQIKEGVLYTDNTRMNGSAGDLYIKGNTSFVNNTLDYKMSYKPNLTSSLPVLAWIATTNPVIFLAGVAIDQVITSKVVSEFNFELTGSVDEPKFKEVNRKSRNVSVGRSKPPEFVDTSDKIRIQKKKQMNEKSFKQFKSPESQHYEQDLREQDLREQDEQLDDFNEG